MGTVGDLIARLLCDSSNFDNNIKKSQKEVQEFKRKTEQSAAKVNNSFNSMGSVVGRVNPKIGSLVGSLGKLGTVAAVGGAAIGGLSEIIKHNEYLTDTWEKTVTQASGALDTLWTTMAQGANSWRNLISNLKESIALYGKLAEIKDNLGTSEGFALLSGSSVDAKIAKYKETKRNPNATKEQIAKDRKDAEYAINRDYVVTLEQKKWLKEQYENQVEGIYSVTNGRNPVPYERGKKIIKNFIEDKPYYNRFKDAASKFSATTPADQLIKNKFFKSLVKNLFGDAYTEESYKSMFDPKMLKYNRGIIAGLRDFIKNLADKLPEATYLRPAQNTLVDINKIDATASARKNAYFKELNNDKTLKPVGGSVYTSKQEAPKEKTLQDILDDLDKSLVWNKYLAQNLGEDVTGANLSTLEKTANELKDLLKDTTDEEQRKNILSVLKTLYNIINKPKEAKKPANNANFENIYGNEIGNLSLNNTTREKILSGIKEAKEWEIAFRDALKNDKHLKVDLDDVMPVDTARKYNYNADEYFKNRSYRNIDAYNKNTVQSIFNGYKFSDYKYLNSEKRYKPSPDPNNKISSFIPFGELSKLNIPIKYPEEFYYDREASSKFSSGVASIVKKYTGFDTFRRDFAKNAYSEFDRLISEGNIITPDDVNKILYQVYLDTIEKHTDTTPDFFKNSSDFVRFIDERTNTNFNDKKVKSKADLILGEKNKNELIYQELLNSVSVPKEAKAGVGDDIRTVNTKSRAISPINFGTDYIIDFINEFSKGNIYEKAEILKNIKGKLTERREALTNLAATVDTGEDRIKLNDKYKNLRLIQLEKEKRSNKGVLSEGNQKEYEDLKKETSNDFSGLTDAQLDTFAESFTKDAEELAKSIEEANSVRKGLEDKINQNDDVTNRIKKEEDENNVLRERQKTLKELSNKYMSVADSAYQIGAAFSTLDSKFGDVAGVLLNVVGITAEAIGKLIGMATAEGVSNAFKLPWPQNLAAVATVVAAGASAAGQIAGLASKKYATGGIVSGPGTGISDSIPIRVSNGEMILNHRQQSNLFNLLDKGSSNSKLSSGEVEFKISGSSLVGVLRNYNNVNNKIR